MNKLLFSLMILFNTGLGFTEAPAHLNPISSHHQNIFSITGILRNEQDEPYGFNLSISRQNNHLQAQASISDLNQDRIVWHQTETLTQLQIDETLEHLGSFFWHYSPVNSTFIIGYENNKQQVFNLKFDLLEPTKITPTSSLTKDLKIKQFWAPQINGHIRIQDQEQFVLSQGTWIQQIWQNETDTQIHPFQELLCKFQDGQSLFAIQTHESKAIRASFAGRFDAQGKKIIISQFLNLTLPQEGDIHIPLDKQHESLNLHPLTQQMHLKIFSSHLSPTQNSGICVYLTNPWLSLSQMQIPPPGSKTFFKNILAFYTKPFKIPFNLKNKLTS